MIAIRGATTVAEDNPELISVAVAELLGKIWADNMLGDDNVVAVIFSNTKDLRSFYPAKAARTAGYFNFALFSAQEPDIEGALAKCIRVLVLAEKEGAPKHCYLNGAAVLRKDISRKFAVAVDGPAGSGKSTVSKLVADKLNILHLDTGAMYRACALACKNNGIDPKNEQKVEKLLKTTDISVKYENGVQHTFLNGEDVSSKIRTPEISMLASTVSALGCVRFAMVELQREIAENNSCILDGRDIGTNVLPNAEFKFYLTASPEIRAKRRMAEDEAKGVKLSFDDVVKDIVKRDRQDETRAIAPLKKAPDAIEINTDNITAAEVAQAIIKKIQEKI